MKRCSSCNWTHDRFAAIRCCELRSSWHLPVLTSILFWLLVAFPMAALASLFQLPFQTPVLVLRCEPNFPHSKGQSPSMPLHPIVSLVIPLHDTQGSLHFLLLLANTWSLPHPKSSAFTDPISVMDRTPGTWCTLPLSVCWMNMELSVGISALFSQLLYFSQSFPCLLYPRKNHLQKLLLISHPLLSQFPNFRKYTCLLTT